MLNARLAWIRPRLVTSPRRCEFADAGPLKDDVLRKSRDDAGSGGCLLEFRILGPLEVWDGRATVDLGRPQQRAVLAVLLIRANEVVSRDRLIDELWGNDPPRKAANTLQVYVSHLRKLLGASTIETKQPGYVLNLSVGALDLHGFERQLERAAAAFRDGYPERAAEVVSEALALWRGAPLADFASEDFARSTIMRLDELRLSAIELSIDAELALGRNDRTVGRLEELISQEPTRERFREQLMLALYRSGRQAEALAAYQAARQLLVDQLGIEPGRALRELEQAVLRQDPALNLPSGSDDSGPQGEGATSVLDLRPDRAIVLAGETIESIDRLISVAEPLARQPGRELIVACLGHDGTALAETMAALDARRARLAERGVSARVTTFTSEDPGADIVRLTALPDVDLALVEGSGDPGEAPLPAAAVDVLERAPCDAGLVWARDGGVKLGDEADVFVPFGGDEHEFTASEIAAWVARSNDAQLWLLGRTSSEGEEGRDASRLLGNVALAVQRVTKVVAKPLLVDPGADAVLEAARGAGLLVLGFPDDWQRRGLGTVRAVLARDARPPVLAIRAGSRPSGVVPQGQLTRFSWTLSGTRA